MINESNNNHGILLALPRPKDFILGANGLAAVHDVKDWSIYLPEKEMQRPKNIDFMICVTMSGCDHCIATQLNYLLFNNLLSDEALYFFHNEGYIVNGLFSLSSRFNAELNGTEKLKGQYMNVAADCLRRDGFIPETDWPSTIDMSWNEFYREIPAVLIAKGKRAKMYVDIAYQWINGDIREALKTAPVQVATAICAGWDSGQKVPACTDNVATHATMIYGLNKEGNYLILDQYEPYKKVLDKAYNLIAQLQYIVTPKNLLRNGMHGENVLQLQKDLNKLGFALLADGDFGNRTETAVRSFQNKAGIASDGIVGETTLAKLKQMTAPKTLLDAVILVETGGDDDAEGDTGLSDHAYGCLQIRQPVCDDVNRTFGTRYKAEQCLGRRDVSIDIWNKFFQVYPILVTNEDRARAWNGGPSWKKIYMKAGKTANEVQYCKNLDIYWSKVKKLL